MSLQTGRSISRSLADLSKLLVPRQTVDKSTLISAWKLALFAKRLSLLFDKFKFSSFSLSLQCMSEIVLKYPKLSFNIVLVEPQIPNNTGNIGRLGVATHSRLHLIHPLGFELTDSRVFGKEAVGLSAEIQERFKHQLVTIPFPGKVRSFNLANAVAMALGEGMRQLTEFKQE